MKVPTRRFGRTEVQMPVLTCGGMRYQQGWEDLDPSKIDPKIQANLEDCIYQALDYGINHIETARGYGPSEMQLGMVLPKIERDRFMIQTKIGVKETGNEFLETFETSMNYLHVEYVDFLSIHGINTFQDLEIIQKKGGAIEAVRQLQKEGRVKHFGFSTHSYPEIVNKVCESGEFDYVNLHWYFIYDQLHRSMVDAAARMDMGVFVISPNDKGGMLYNPLPKLETLCDPLTPMQWHDLFCLSRPEVHTLSIGAAEPSHYNQHVEAVTKYYNDPMVQNIEQKIMGAMNDALGADWVQHWHENIPPYPACPGEINVREILRLWTFHHGIGIEEFAKTRYNMMGNIGYWFPGQKAEHIDSYDWSCLSGNRFAGKIPSILKEAHALFNEDKEVKRLSDS